MRFERPLIQGRLIRRYKRFLADVELPNGQTITAHTPNTGSMLGCAEPGSTVWLLDTQNPKRKYPYAWELVENLQGQLIGINTLLANKLVAEAIEAGVIKELQGYAKMRSEAVFAEASSRFDLLLENDQQSCFVEVKNVTAVNDEGMAIFPDAVSARGLKHLHALALAKQSGYRAVLCFCVQRCDAQAVRAAVEIDPAYARGLHEVHQQGVEIIAYKACPSPQEISLSQSLPVETSYPD